VPDSWAGRSLRGSLLQICAGRRDNDKQCRIHDDCATYNADEPGQYCGNTTRVNQWEIGERYTKTINGKSAEVRDTYTKADCQSDGSGTLLTRSGDYSAYSELFFHGLYGENSLAPHFFAQVDATFVSGDAHATAILDVHLDSHTYGRDSFTPLP
jgi:hypothetical protein